MKIDWRKISAVVGGLVILVAVGVLVEWLEFRNAEMKIQNENSTLEFPTNSEVTEDSRINTSTLNLVDDLLRGDYKNLRVAMSRGDKIPNGVLNTIKAKSFSKLSVKGYDVFLFSPKEDTGIGSLGWCGGDMGSRWWGGDYQMFSVKGDKIMDFEDVGHLGFNEGRIFNGLHKYAIPKIEEFILIFQYGVCGENDLRVYKLDSLGNFNRVYFVSGDEGGRISVRGSVSAYIENLDNFEKKISSLLCYGEDCGNYKSYKYNVKGGTFIKNVYPPKFVEPKLGDVSSWKTYKDEKYGFEIKYPDDWYYFSDYEDRLSIVFQNEKGECAHGVGCFYPGSIEVFVREFPIEFIDTYDNFDSFIAGGYDTLGSEFSGAYFYMGGLRAIKTAWERCGNVKPCDFYDRDMTVVIDFSPKALIEISVAGREYDGYGYKNYVLLVVEEMLKTFKKTE